MRILRSVVIAALCGVLLIAGYACYWHLRLAQQRRFAENFFAVARKWQPLQTSQKVVEQDLANLDKKQKVWCGDGQCIWSHLLEAKPVPSFMSKVPGVRWSRMYVDVTFKDGVLIGVSAIYKTSYSNGMFRVFSLAPICWEGDATPQIQTWVVAPSVTTLPPGSGRAMQQCYKPTLSQDKWLSVLHWNLDCIDRWHPCTEWSELMPNTWMEFKRQGSQEPVYGIEPR